ncbi:MAG: hypothetical protein ABI758_00660 [Candidatus Woesebacteria bacterium]
MHWSWWIIFPVLLLEPLRGIANHDHIVWLQTILNQGIFTHIGDADNAFFIILVPLVFFTLLRIRNRKMVLAIIAVAIVVSIYAVLDEEIPALPLFNMGTPDLLDIPGGVLGWICGIFYSRYWLKRHAFL